jgi:FKBP-type peptidyl-prolyl cis-trans isomerase FkpA
MSSVTAVPLLPIRKGSLTRFWLAMLLLLLVAAALAWVGLRPFGQSDNGLRYMIVAPGAGAHPTKDDFALVAYKGMLPDGTVFDENARAPLDLTQMLPGFTEAVMLVGKGGKVRAFIPAELAYGANPPPTSKIPSNSPLIFEISLLEFETRENVMAMRRQMEMQQMLQQQMGGGGMPPMPQGDVVAP